jgi:hypothetical protein
MKTKLLLLLWLIATLNFSANAELRLLEITEPGTFIADTGRFSDAYYVMTEAPVEVKAKLIYDGVQDLTDMKARIRIYQELSDGSFSQEIFLEKEIFYSIKGKEELTIDFELGAGQGEKFFPMTYNNILYSDSNFYYPPWFKNMLWNVTPRYKIEIELLDANSQVISSQTRNVRFFVNFIFYDERKSYQIYTILDRAIWLNQAIDYSKYNYVYWADGDDKPIPQVERDNIIRYLNSGTTNLKKYLAICSQELAREHCKEGSQPDSVFHSSYMRAENVSPGNPKGKGISCDSIKFKGYSVNRDIIKSVKKTEFENDEPPYCGLVSVEKYGDGLGLGTAVYLPDSLYGRTNTAGVSVVTLQKGQVYYAIDWRHFENCDDIIRGILDYFDRNYQDNYKTYLKKNIITDFAFYPGRNVECSYSYFQVYNDYYSDTSYYSNENIIIENSITNTIDTIVTDEYGKALYTFTIPKYVKPGYYQITDKTDIVTSSGFFEILKSDKKIIGYDYTCEMQIKKYFIVDNDYNKHWQVEGGEIISNNTDSSEIIVKWGEKGQGKVTVNVKKDSIDEIWGLNITIREKPIKPTISQIGNKLVCSDTLLFDWYLNGELIKDERKNVLEPIFEGIYTCHTYYYCVSEMSDPFYYKKTDVTDTEIEDIRIYPNPFTDNLYIEFPSDLIYNSEIRIYNSLGILIKEFSKSEVQKLTVWSACNNDESQVPNGIYYLEVNSGNRKQLFKISLIR